MDGKDSPKRRGGGATGALYLDAMKAPEHVVVLTGAGMSAESGIATFRGAGGLWEGHRVEEVATPEAWHRNPELVTRFYNERRRAVWEAEPNAGHRTLAQWQDRFHVQIITQNVDDLHERAGSHHVLHLHGELAKARSCGPGEEVYALDHWEMRSTDRCGNGHPLRPHIVWFGEAVPKMAEAYPLMAEADCIVVIGTSLQVYPAAQLAFEGRPGVPLHVIDPSADALGVPSARAWSMGASEGLAQLSAYWNL